MIAKKKRLDALTATQKMRTPCNRPFKKKLNLTTKKVKKKKKKKKNSFCRFSLFISKFITCIGCFNAYMKCYDPLSSFQQKLSVFYVPFWREKIWKNCKKGQIYLAFLYDHVSFKKKLCIQMSSFFFALQSLHQNASFMLSNNTIQSFSFFTFVRGYPY